MQWDIVIGLEIHVQLCTKSKLFSSASTQYGAKNNSQASYVDLALPGVLPVVNLEALNMAIKFGLSIGGKICQNTVFSRKNYFYPDLPKGYQISQDAFPIIQGGSIDISMSNKNFSSVNITRAHLEEDAGQSTHEGEDAGKSGINLNRAGIPLLEIVTEPVISSIPEAIALLKTIRTLVRYLGISTGNMQEGAMRCDVNISLRKNKDAPLGSRVELKNINSFKFVEKALEYEIKRQSTILANNGKVEQETRLYDSAKNTTKTMRSKEDALDYRYFPDPDLPKVQISKHHIERIKQEIPELPWQKSKRFISDYRIHESEARIMCLDPLFADYFEEIVEYSSISGKTVANWLCGEYLNLMKQNQTNHNKKPISSKNFADLLIKINDNIISGSNGKVVLAELFVSSDSVDNIIKNKNLLQISNNDELTALAKQVIANNPKQLEQYKAGKDKLFGFFVGQAMKLSHGKANPKVINDLIRKELDKNKI